MFSAATFNGQVEFFPGFAPRPHISHAVFDFDGTLSWLRHGWPDLMYGVFRAHYPGQPGETEAAIHDRLIDEILALNGKPSVFQMERFVELARQRGAQPPAPAELLHNYQNRLDDAIRERSELILTGKARAEDFIVHGARPLLDELHERGVELIILSGTLEERVRQEAELLGLTDYFGMHIYGSQPDTALFSKRAVLDRLLAEEKIRGEHLLSFGDGPVEILHTKELGGLAIAVASDEEHNGSGIPDPHKRRQLIAAGADAVIADYRNAAALLELIFRR
jgi:phosphoglycolate phosphatase